MSEELIRKLRQKYGIKGPLDPNQTAVWEWWHWELNFVEAILKRQGWLSAEATPHENMTQHFDFCCTDQKGRIHRVEVKAAKRLQRNGPYSDLQDEYLVAELVSAPHVPKGKDGLYPIKKFDKDDPDDSQEGWLYGKADFIASGLVNGDFRVIDREHLVEFVTKRTDFSCYTNNPLDGAFRRSPGGFYVPYRRPGYWSEEIMKRLEAVLGRKPSRDGDWAWVDRGSMVYVPWEDIESGLLEDGTPIWWQLLRR